MEQRFVRWMVLAGAVLAIAPAMAQTPAGAKVDLSGIWSPITGTEAEFFAQPEMTAWAKKKAVLAKGDSVSI